MKLSPLPRSTAKNAVVSGLAVSFGVCFLFLAFAAASSADATNPEDFWTRVIPTALSVLLVQLYLTKLLFSKGHYNSAAALAWIGLILVLVIQPLVLWVHAAVQMWWPH
jgi:FtsH-binding integral membrane protein